MTDSRFSGTLCGMFNSFIVFSVLFGFYVNAAPSKQDMATAPSSATEFNSFAMNVRSGFLLSSADDQVQEKWEHDTFSSYLFGIGLYYRFPRAWKQLHFFGGGDFGYMVSEEEISNVYLTSTFTQLFLTGGLTYLPTWLGGRWGFGFFTSFELWGQKIAKLQSNSFDAEVSKGKTHVNDSLLPVEFATGVSVSYQLLPQWTPYVGLEKRMSFGGNALTFGVNYVF